MSSLLTRLTNKTSVSTMKIISHHIQSSMKFGPISKSKLTFLFNVVVVGIKSTSTQSKLLISSVILISYGIYMKICTNNVMRSEETEIVPTYNWLSVHQLAVKNKMSALPHPPCLSDTAPCNLLFSKMNSITN